MRVLFCLDYYYPHLGGAEILFQNLAEGLVARGHEVDVVTQAVRDAPLEEAIQGVRVHRVRTGDSRNVFCVAALPTMLRLAKHADVIHASTFAAAWPAALAAKLRRKPSVLTVHEVWIGMWNQVSDAGRLSNAFHDLAERTIYWPRYTRYIAVSHATERALANFVPGERICTIYNGLDYTLWNPSEHDGKTVRASLPLPSDAHIFFFSGRPGRSKGFPVLLKAFAEVVRQAPNACLLALLSTSRACAEGYREARCLVQELALEEKVLIHAPVPRLELPSWVAAADTVCVPSLSEGFGFCAAEASALGRPVIATDNASLPEVIGGKYLLVPPANSKTFAAAMLRAIHNDYDTRPLPHFSLQDNILQHEKLYEAVASG